jgi:hypothetical protein
MTSRESSLSACAWLAARIVIAAQSQTRTRVIILPHEIKKVPDETGHTGAGFASNEPVTAPFSASAVKKHNMRCAIPAMPG